MRAFLIDLDGVLYVGKSPIKGAKECLKLMEDRGYSYRFVSNSTRRCRSSVAKRLEGLGYDVPAGYIFTPPLAAIEHMKKSGKDRCFADHRRCPFRFRKRQGLLSLTQMSTSWSWGWGQIHFDRLNIALRLILEGAEILAWRGQILDGA
jgi:hypothetical protein